MKGRIKFQKNDEMKFIGHLDLMRFFQKAFRRSGLPTAFSGGYSPHMIMSFAQPLGVGMTSEGEYLDVEFKSPVREEEVVLLLNNEMVPGIKIERFIEIEDSKHAVGMTIVRAADYRVSMADSKTSEPVLFPTEFLEKLTEFLNQPAIVVLKKTKRSEVEADIRPMIYEYEVNPEYVTFKLAAGSAENLKPQLVMDCFIDQYRFDKVCLKYHRLDLFYKISEKKFISLGDLRKIDYNILDLEAKDND